ncbi:MAG: hypothetical protein K8T90_02425 [Planctomycetes bacterium]|nr:hypothetical protein [Planctomycetota bacterium]
MTTASRFHGFSFRLRDREVREFGEDRLATELGDADVFSWIDLESSTKTPLLDLLACLGVDAKVADRLDAPEILPWIVERPNCVAFRLYEIDRPERHLDTAAGIRAMEASRMLVILGKDFVVTWHACPLDVVDEVKATCGDAFRLAGRTPNFVAFLFLQRCLYDYADLNLANDNFLDGFGPAPGRSCASNAEQIEVAGRNILTLKKLATSLHIVCMLLATKRTPFVSDEGRASFRDLQENAISVRSAVDDSRDLLNGVLGSLQTEAANRTSEIAGVLTVVSVIMLPLGLLAGIWGMNFEVLPLVKHEYGFWLLMGGMVTIAALLFWTFRRVGWIRR